MAWTNVARSHCWVTHSPAASFDVTVSGNSARSAIASTSFFRARASYSVNHAIRSATCCSVGTNGAEENGFCSVMGTPCSWGAVIIYTVQR
jgi:hypothetical protein